MTCVFLYIMVETVKLKEFKLELKVWCLERKDQAIVDSRATTAITLHFLFLKLYQAQFK